MTAQTPAQRNASYRRRMAEKMARYEGALITFVAVANLYPWAVNTSHMEMALQKAKEALNPTDPAKDAKSQ